MQSLKSAKGSSVITTPIVIAILLFFFAMILLLSVNILMPYIWYEKLSSTAIKYVFIMEEYGYLSPDEKTNLSNDLTTAGFNTSDITITATDSPADYGEPIFLNIAYNYRMNLPVLNLGSLSATQQNNIVQMNVRKQSVSKK